MSFASYEYILLFLPIVVLLFWKIQQAHLARALWLLTLASLVFYAQWNPRDILVIGLSIAFNYHCAARILRHDGRERATFIAAVVVNLLVLGYFKYLGFATQLLGIGPVVAGHDLRAIVLPLGISFFTFTQIAYLADCHTGKLSMRDHRPRDYILFVSFFPHLIAGPILHHRSIIPQFHGDFRKDRLLKMQTGLVMFAIGLFKKVIVADNFALLAAPVFADAQTGHALHTLTAWQGALAYTLQIYFDFSGYSDMAVGSALMIGMHIPFNFFSPYKATSIIDFWRRWHISLSIFLRDYLYIPLGGNRHGTARRYVNVFATMLLGGIWHGAGMTFVIWGALHGAFITINHMWRDYLKARSLRLPDNALIRIAAYLLTMLAVVIGWVFFRAPSVQAAATILASMGSLPDAASLPPLTMHGSEIIAGLAFTLLMPNSRQIHDWMLANGSARIWARLGLASGLATAFGLIFISADSPFLYFQF